jgi:hypothetical protein
MTVVGDRVLLKYIMKVKGGVINWALNQYMCCFSKKKRLVRMQGEWPEKKPTLLTL